MHLIGVFLFIVNIIVVGHVAAILNLKLGNNYRNFPNLLEKYDNGINYHKPVANHMSINKK